MQSLSLLLLYFLFVSMILSFLAACGSDEERMEPRAVNEGKDKCEICHMMVPDDHHATQIVLTDGRHLMFDDVGDMWVWLEEQGEEEVDGAYVRDYHTEEWILFEEATFVYHEDFRTPMAYGIYSFASEEDAISFQEEEGMGDILSYEDLSSHSWERNMELMEEHDHDHHDHDHDEDEHVEETKEE